MIIKSSEINCSNENLIVIISGLPGVGKTTLGFSAPDALLIDFDKGVKRTKPEHRKDIISVNTYAELLKDIEAPEMSNYKTIIFDTCGQFIDLLKEWAIGEGYHKKDGDISLQGFGAVKQEFLRFSNKLKKTHNIVFMFHTLKEKDSDGQTVFDLMCEGATKQTVWIPTDLGAYIDIINGDRYAHFAPSQQYSAKKSYGVADIYKIPTLADGQKNDFLTKLFEQVRANIKKETETLSPQKAGYEAAMSEGKKIIDGVAEISQISAASEDIKKLNHSLTSEAELKSLLKSKCADIGAKWDKVKKEWVSTNS